MSMIYKKFIIIFLYLTYTVYVYAEADPFSRSFVTENNEGNSSFTSSANILGENPDVHPLISLDENQYIIKGVVIAEDFSLAIVSYPGGKDYLMRQGDPLGKNMYTIKKINLENLMLQRTNFEDIDLTVFNPVAKSSNFNE